LKKYEAVFIIDERGSEDEGRGFSDEFGKLVSDLGGKIEETVPMGRKQFAREIRKRKAGYYWDFVFTLTPDQVLSIRDRYRLDERVLRLQVFNYDRPE